MTFGVSCSVLTLDDKPNKPGLKLGVISDEKEETKDNKKSVVDDVLANPPTQTKPNEKLNIENLPNEELEKIIELLKIYDKALREISTLLKQSFNRFTRNSIFEKQIQPFIVKNRKRNAVYGTDP